jgi:hypothetical protein
MSRIESRRTTGIGESGAGAFALRLLALVLLANSALAQLTLEDSSPEQGFDVLMTEGETQVFSVVVSGSATPTYTWFIGGVDQNSNSSSFTLAPGLDFVQNRFNGERINIWCDVSAGDSILYAAGSWIVIVSDANQPPSVGTIQLQESPQGRASRFGSMEVYIREGHATDPDPGETIYYEFTWSNGEKTVVDGPKSETSSTLDTASEANGGDVWTCTLRVVDALSAVSTDFVQSQEFVVNNLPVIEEAGIFTNHPFIFPDPFNFNSAAIGGYPGNITDADHEDQNALSSRFQWLVDSGEVSGLGDFADLPLDTGRAFPGSVVQLAIYPQDSYDEGLPAYSPTITVGKLLHFDLVTHDGTHDSLQVGFYEGASVGADQFDASGGAYMASLDSLDVDNSNFYGRQVVPPADEYRFYLYVHNFAIDLSISWPYPNIFDSEIWLMEINESGRIISDKKWDLTQAGSMQIEYAGRARLFQVWFRPFGSLVELRKLRPGWNLLTPRLALTEPSIPGSVGPGIPENGFTWNVGAESLQPVAEFAGLNGCWLHVNVPDPVLMEIGQPAPATAVTLQPGWNLIGVSRQMAVPSGPAFRSPFWGWNGSYRIAHELVPGEAYWINVSETVDLPVGP